MFWIIFWFTLVFFLSVFLLSKFEVTRKSRNVSNELGEIVLEKGVGTLRSNDHPLLTSVLHTGLVVTENHLVISNKDSVVIPIKHVRAEITTVSSASATGIIAFGLAGLAAKERLYIFKVDDRSSGEQYTSVFTGKLDSIAETINRQRYESLILEREMQKDE